MSFLGVTIILRIFSILIVKDNKAHRNINRNNFTGEYKVTIISLISFTDTASVRK